MLRPRVSRVFRLGLRRGQLARDIHEELEAHLTAHIDHLETRGLSRDAARAEALRRLGPLDDVYQQLFAAARRREDRMRFSEWLDAIRHDLRDATRVLARAPGFSLLVAGTIALAVGANAAMFGVIDRLLLSGPRHVIEPDRIRRVYVTTEVAGQEPRTSSLTGYATYTDLRDGTRSFAMLAAYGAEGDVTLDRGSEAQKVRGRQATWTLFPLLGVQPHLGRFFGPDEDRPPRGERVTVIGYELWRTRLGADPAVLGLTVAIDGDSYTIVGVAPRGFTGPDLAPVDVWIPVSTGYAPSDDWPTTRRASWLSIIGRLAPGISPEQADADASAAHGFALAESGGTDAAVRVSVRPLHFDRNGRESLEVTVSRWLVGVAAIVLLIACANVANMLLARGLQRRRELAVRVALGMGRSRLVRLLLVEALVLALLGGAAGLAVAFWGGELIRKVLFPDVAWDASPVDARVVGFAFAASLVTALLIGLVPALRASRPDATVALKEGAPQAGATRSRLRASLTVVQAALSVVLLVGAGLFVRSLSNVRNLDLGIEADRVLVTSLAWMPLAAELTDDERARERTRRVQVRARVLEELGLHPGVASAAWGIGTPFRGAMTVDLRVPGFDSIPVLPGDGPYISAVSPGYFAAVGTALLEGRPFDERDHARSERVAMVNRTMARTLWPGESPLGKCLLIGDEPPGCARVVGVVEDARRFRLREEAAMQYYVPLGQETGIAGPTLLVRPRGDADAFLPELRAALRRLDPTLDLSYVRVLEDALDPQVRPWRLGATVFVCFGVLALLVAAIGMYSVVSYVTAQRTHELGVRTALGARGVHIARLVIGRGLVTVAVGVGIGAAIALAAGRFVEPLLFDTAPTDIGVFAGAASTILVAALIATLPPVRRAMRVDPVVALRSD